jgi:hypothetical protein
MSRTGEKVRRRRGEGAVEDTKTRTHCRERKAGIHVDESVLEREMEEARPPPVRICGWVGCKRPRRKYQTRLVPLGLPFLSIMRVCLAAWFLPSIPVELDFDACSRCNVSVVLLCSISLVRHRELSIDRLTDVPTFECISSTPFPCAKVCIAYSCKKAQ